MPQLQLFGTVAFIGGVARTSGNILYKSEPGLMFVTKRKTNGEIQIYQDTRIDLAKNMKGYTAVEKAGMMALQTLVGFSRQKENLKYSDYELGENGEKIYLQKISTVTHGVNLKTLKMIEDLGYIKIDSMEEKYKQTLIEKALGREKRGSRKLLVTEKIGFKNYGDLKKIFKAAITNDKETLENMKKTFQKITFRLTDKKIDYEELYNKSSNLSEIEDKKERLALKRLAIIFDNKQGILSSKNIDIGKDNFGRDVLKYNTKEPFGRRVERARMLQKQREDFHDRIKEDVDLSQINRQIIEKQLNQDKDKKQEADREIFD